MREALGSALLLFSLLLTQHAGNMKSCGLASGTRCSLAGRHTHSNSSLNQKLALEKIAIASITLIALARALPAIRPTKPSTNGAGLLAQRKLLAKPAAGWAAPNQ